MLNPSFRIMAGFRKTHLSIVYVTYTVQNVRYALYKIQPLCVCVCVFQIKLIYIVYVYFLIFKTLAIIYLNIKTKLLTLLSSYCLGSLCNDRIVHSDDAIFARYSFSRNILDCFAKNLKSIARRETQLAMGKELILELKFYRRRGTGTSAIRSYSSRFSLSGHTLATRLTRKRLIMINEH